MPKITNSTIDAALASFTTNRDKLRDQAHAIAMMIFYHAAPKEVSDDCNGTGDCTRAPKLIEVMPRGWADLMRTWFHTFTPIRISTDGKTVGYDKKYAKLSADKKLDWWKLEEANTTRFDLLAEDRGQGVRILDFDTMVKMVGQLANRIENKVKEDEVKPEDVLTAKAIASALSGLKFERVKASDVETNDDGHHAVELAPGVTFDASPAQPAQAVNA